MRRQGLSLLHVKELGQVLASAIDTFQNNHLQVDGHIEAEARVGLHSVRRPVHNPGPQGH